MADYKNKKSVKLGGLPSPNNQVKYGADPGSIMSQRPSWKLASCDISSDGRWSFTKERLQDVFWDVIFPKLRQYETMTWSQIFMEAKKQNHSEDVGSFSKAAQKRLSQMQIEVEAIHSLRLGSTLRIYGFLSEHAVFNILWYDDNHGDNDTCVRRSKLKHT